MSKDKGIGGDGKGDEGGQVVEGSGVWVLWDGSYVCCSWWRNLRNWYKFEWW